MTENHGVVKVKDDQLYFSAMQKVEDGWEVTLVTGKTIHAAEQDIIRMPKPSQDKAEPLEAVKQKSHEMATGRLGVFNISQGVKLVPTRTIKNREPFNTLFSVDPKILDAVVAHMVACGFDPSQPIVVWRNNGEDIVIDGHTRLQAAKQIKLTKVYVARMIFNSETQALEYAIHNQRDRRNLTDGDLLRCIEAVDKLKQRGGDHKSEKSKASTEAIEKGKSSEETARIVGTSRAKVERSRTVLANADDQTKQAALDGSKSINRAYQEIKKGKEDQALSAAPWIKDGPPVDENTSKWGQAVTCVYHLLDIINSTAFPVKEADASYVVRVLDLLADAVPLLQVRTKKYYKQLDAMQKLHDAAHTVQ